MVKKQMTAQERWKLINPRLQEHIREILAFYLEDKSLPSEVINRYNKYNKENEGLQARADHLNLALYESLSCMNILTKLADRVSCYREDSNSRITLHGLLRESLNSDSGTGVAVMEGRIVGYDTRPVAVKWYRGSVLDTSHEISLYRAIKRESSATLPWFSGSYQIWGDPVLVIEMLNVLDDDDEVDVGIDILNRLKVIHRVCLHCDIKPCNIVRSLKGSKPTYYLIDFGQSTLLHEKKGSGYVRRVHTKKYFRQGYKTMTTVKTELVELLIALRDIQSRRVVKPTGAGPLQRYQKVLDQEPEDPDGSVYDRLIVALSKKK